MKTYFKLYMPLQMACWQAATTISFNTQRDEWFLRCWFFK